jgi:hypothetical protein
MSSVLVSMAVVKIDLMSLLTAVWRRLRSKRTARTQNKLRVEVQSELTIHPGVIK